MHQRKLEAKPHSKWIRGKGGQYDKTIILQYLKTFLCITIDLLKNCEQNSSVNTCLQKELI